MALNGVRSLSRLGIRFCEHGGSSRGVSLLYSSLLHRHPSFLLPTAACTHHPRAFLRSPAFTEFQEKNPHVEVVPYLKNGNHPVLVAEYRNGSKMQIDVKRHDEEEVLKRVMYMNERRGGHIRSWHERKRKVSHRPSIQGEWHPEDWQQVYERDNMDKVEE